MAPKRKRNASLPPKGLSPGEQLKRNAIHGTSSSPWGWVGSEITDTADITLEHRMRACNLSWRNKNMPCRNKYFTAGSKAATTSSEPTPVLSSTAGELDDDIIVISDDEGPSCSKKGCKTDPNCLNYLGQDIWEEEDDAQEEFMKSAKLGKDPSECSRKPGLPVGLKNLGATCYANASLQVWYRDFAFRSGVYSCEPPDNIPEEKYKESPISQLQVTFAALQEGNKSVFNPAKLVESLQLRTSEQQDAQEFSKLFMSHLDAEFKKQSSPSVKSLITEQFQGNQVYGTICHSCKNRSERNSDFLEIEISFESNSKLEDCIAASLLPETLSGDNKYFCSRCETLQDATRYTELRELPPVLHFSLLRFVYDVSTMERKKSKHSISFPLSLDMNKFLGSKNDRGSATSSQKKDNLYELRGVLLHKGASAYNGHYEAQVNDVENGSWFLFNDETVTKIKTLGDKIPLKKLASGSSEKIEDDAEQPGTSTSQARRNRTNARKRRRIEDSDEDVIEVKRTSVGVSPKSVERSSLITSKDAYMLIYAKKLSVPSSEAPIRGVSGYPLLPKPSPRAMQIVRDLNDAHDRACREYRGKEDSAKVRVRELRRRVRDIYSNWTATQSTGSIVVSRQALEAWLSKACIEAALQQKDGCGSPVEMLHSDSTIDDANSVVVSSSGISCEHGLLDPLKSRDMKCIAPHAYEQIAQETNCTFSPIFRASDACAECVSTVFQEKLYELEHPIYTKKFDEISIAPDDEMGYWISKKWCRDWRLIKPRMHVAPQEDPAPDSLEFYSHVYCEHGGLSMNITNRRKISAEAVALLQKLFPAWEPLSSDAEACAICDAEIHVSKEDKREIRRRVEDEKARLRFIYEPSLDAWTKMSEHTTCAVVPSQFIKKWKRWLNGPSDNPKPERVDNTSFLCEHDLLAFDPNCLADLDSSITIIQRDEWDALQSIYEGGPLIALSRRPKEDGGGYNHEVPVCIDCRLKRKTEWDTADIIILLCSSDGKQKSQQKPIVTYGRSNGNRQSKRLRQLKEHGERRIINISKSSTVKDIKIMVNEEFSIPTICQRLFYQGKELDDNSTTVTDLQLLANDTIELREAEEVVEIDSDSDEMPASKRRKEEGQGFGGTLLGNADSAWSSSPEQTPLIPHFTIEEKPCLACTFSNTFDAVSCQICDTIFV